MFQSAFATFELIELPIIAMSVFMVTFAIVVIGALKKRDRAADEHLASLPLSDDPEFDS